MKRVTFCFTTDRLRRDLVEEMDPVGEHGEVDLALDLGGYGGDGLVVPGLLGFSQEEGVEGEEEEL